MKKQQQLASQLASLADLAMAGVKITICATRKAPRQKMRSKNSNGFVTGGNRPASVKASSFGL